MILSKNIVEELLGLDMEPKPESRWWTSTHQAEEKNIESGEKASRQPFLLMTCLKSWYTVSIASASAVCSSQSGKSRKFCSLWTSWAA